MPRPSQAGARTVGAIGLMQIKRATGKELKIGDVTVIEPNVYGTAEYTLRPQKLAAAPRVSSGGRSAHEA